MADKSEWKTPSRMRREGRWTPIRAKAQDTRANPNSWETHLVRKRCGALDSYGHCMSLRIMMMIQGIFHEHRHTFANIVSMMPNEYLRQILHEHLTHTTINVYSRAYD